VVPSQGGGALEKRPRKPGVVGRVAILLPMSQLVYKASCHNVVTARQSGQYHLNKREEWPSCAPIAAQLWDATGPNSVATGTPDVKLAAPPIAGTALCVETRRDDGEARPPHSFICLHAVPWLLRSPPQRNMALQFVQQLLPGVYMLQPDRP
jgi:hypothetical protein